MTPGEDSEAGAAGEGVPHDLAKARGFGACAVYVNNSVSKFKLGPSVRSAPVVVDRETSTPRVPFEAWS